MIGNDIVDLTLASVESNWQRRGWLQKIFTYSEQHIIWEASDPGKMVWQLWSMKEAVYKAHQRRFSLSPKYNPIDFICNGSSVRIHDFQYNTISKSTNKYIHTSTCGNQSGTISRVFIGNSSECKHILRYHVASKMGVTESSVILKKDWNRIPVIKVNNRTMNIPLSISSHGSFSAFTINLQ